MGSRIEMKGKKFNKLTVLSESGRDKQGNILWVCKCDCGTIKSIRGNKLRNSLTKSCGCLLQESGKANGLKRRTHGHSLGYNHSATYRAWAGMKNRCFNKAGQDYKDYGERGISVCDRWLNSFENFLADMGPKPKNKSIDRINNDGDYEPSNCKWSSPSEQSHNRRSSVMTWTLVNKIRDGYESNKETHQQIADRYGVSRVTIGEVIRRKTWVE